MCRRRSKPRSLGEHQEKGTPDPARPGGAVIIDLEEMRCTGRSETPQELAGRGWQIRGDVKSEPLGRKTQGCTGPLGARKCSTSGKSPVGQAWTMGSPGGTPRHGAGVRAQHLHTGLRRLGSRGRQRRLIGGLKPRNSGVNAVCIGTVWSGGVPGLAPPAPIWLEGRSFVLRLSGWGEVARLWGAHVQASGRAPGQTAVPFPDARTGEEVGDNSLSDIWSLRF